MVKSSSRCSTARPPSSGSIVRSGASACSRRIAQWRQSTRAMSRSSVASKPSSAASNLFAAFERRAVPVMRRLGELSFIASLRDALPWSFIGLAAAFLVILIADLAGGKFQGQTLGLRVASALLPAFGVMAATLAVILPIRLARATPYGPTPLLLGSVVAFALALPRPFGPDPIAYLR